MKDTSVKKRNKQEAKEMFVNRIKIFISGRNTGLENRYVKYIAGLDDESLKREYYQIKALSGSVEIVLKLIIAVAYLGMIWKILELILGSFSNINNLLDMFSITRNEAINLVLFLTSIFVMLGILITLALVFFLRYFIIKQKRKMYLEEILKKRKLWDEIGGI